MPADLVNRINLDLLEPAFRENLLNLLAEARGLGFEFFATEGFRSFGRSRDLYAAWQKGGPRAAPAGFSAHNYGLAVDLCRRVGKKGVSWKEADYEPLRSLCPKHTLSWGGLFKDPPHVGHASYVNSNQLMKLRKLWDPIKTDDQNLKVVWSKL